ncbi:class I SAM-dependent methyltransferase [Dinghuibacter sp.]|uniref:O-methyltransferase n=1 Tax=Dinghuibacter sp. TaxID=2024697 RepID=UPI002D8077B7|nr:class I SAM-dependent methyltransferase [Dinghuibacter sp.]
MLSASNGRGHGIHSPFVFDFVAAVLADRASYPEYASVEALRSSLLADGTVLSVEDFGAGVSSSRSVASIARSALKPRKFGQLFFRMARYYQPSSILELGTSLGITTSYLALGAPSASVVTCEGAPAVAAVARRNFASLGLSSLRVIEGNFDDTLSLALAPSLDFVYVDGNHRLEPTLRYFRQMQPFLHADSIVVFDDIHWSEEMEEAWAALKADPSVTCSVDLFYIGILFFRREFFTPQHFTIRF